MKHQVRHEELPHLRRRWRSASRAREARKVKRYGVDVVPYQPVYDEGDDGGANEASDDE